MFASGTCAEIILLVLSGSPDLCSTHSFICSFNPSAQDLSGTKDGLFFLKHKKEMVAHHFSVICPVQAKSTSTFRNKTGANNVTLNLGNR